MNTLTQRVINGYEFREKVGSGGFGVVYRGVQPALGREVAIKVILPEHAAHPEFVKRFEREALLIAHLEHPHIVPLYDYWRDESGAYLVMRWLPDTVRQRIQQKPFAPGDAANLLDQVAGALSVAHRSHVIHRDIKPDNLLLDSQDNTYLADFGIAKAIDSSFITTAKQLVGSMAYIAPEQINELDLTPQADIYSLGVAMYEILTGVQPYAGSSVSALLQHHLSDPLPSLRAQRPDLPASLDAVLARATAKNPAERYEDVIRFARAFRAALPAPRHVQPLAEPLTERELEILTLLADGLSNGEIAERLYVSLSTIKWYKKQIYSKLDVHSLETAIAHARALGLIPDDTQEADQVASAAPEHTVVSVAMASPRYAAPSQLPAPTTPLIGREVEIAALSSLLRDPANRLISVLAPGGMGKTRLALEVASRLAGEFRHGAAFIALNAVSAPEHIVSAMATAVGVSLSGQLDPTQQLLEHFRPQHLLLVLDNFEHLLDAAPLLTQILETAPQVKILTTTRERLNLSVETVFPLSGLDIPGAHAADDLLAYGSVRLFVGAARRAPLSAEYTRDNLIQIGRICRLAQGMPLAILLAASWTDLLKVGEIADEVSKGIDFLESQWRDLPERQRSIRAVFDASWRRLSPTEAEALAKLSVFRGGFTRRAGERVAGASLRTLSALVNKALLWMDAEGRCSIHDLLRQYAAEQLEAAGSGDAARAAHSAYYLETLASLESDLTGLNQTNTQNDVEVDIENVRAAVIWAASHRDYARLANAVHPLWLYFFYRGGYVDGASLFELLTTALRQNQAAPPRDALLGDVLTHRAQLLIFMFERARADECLAEAEPLVEASGDARIRAFYRMTRADRLPWENYHTWALSSAREAQALYQSIGDKWGEAFASYHIGSGFLYGDQLSAEEIRDALDRTRALSEAIGDTLMYATTLTAYALLNSANSGSTVERVTLFEQVLAVRRVSKNPIRVANALINTAIQKAALGRLTDALRDIEEAVAIKRQQGSVHDTVGFDDLGEIYFRMGKLAEARPIFEEALSYVAGTEQHSWRNLYRLYLMELAYAEGDYEQVEALAAEIAKEDGGANLEAHHHRLTCVMGMAGLAALAQGNLAAAQNWYARAEHSAEADHNRNGAMFAQTVSGLLALTEGDSGTALSRLETAVDYFQNEYAYDLSQDFERDLGLALALTGCSRALVRLDQAERAVACYQEALRHAERLQVDAFALMALIPAAEVALGQGDPQQAATLAALAAEHPHAFAYDRAEAARLLAAVPNSHRSTQAAPDLWLAVADLCES